MAQRSEKVRDRTAQLIKLVKIDAIEDCSQKLLVSIATGEGTYIAFLERWGYDEQQRELICQAFQQVI